MHSPWTMPKSAHGPVLIKGGVSGFKLQVTFYKLLDSYCNFPCTCMLKRHFGENLIPHVQLRAIFLTPLQQAFCKPPLKTFPRVKEMKFIYAKNVQKSIIQ